MEILPVTCMILHNLISSALLCSAVEEDSRENIWIGTTGGLYLYERRKRFVYTDGHYFNPTISIHFGECMIWIASNKG
jgi:hypothetical protein